MSKVSRKLVVNEEKRDSPVKEMKKKMAANAEKEKQATEKAEKPADKPAEKQTEKAAEKPEKNDKVVAEKKHDKNADKSEKLDKSVTEKKVEKHDKSVTEKKIEKVADKNEKKPEPQVEKGKEDNKEDKSGKSDKPEQKKSDLKPKQNGRETRVLNGGAEVTGANGSDDVTNGTVGADSDDEVLVIDDQDEMFPELTYDESDVEFDPAEAVPTRSFTRRSQVKATRTPETPRPASDKQTDKEADDPKDSKVLKLKEDAPPTDRKLRSADSPKPESKKKPEKEQESPKKPQEKETEDAAKAEEKDKKEESKSAEENGEKSERVDIEVVVEVENGESRKPDTNYSKSRVKVSPYRRSGRLADQTNSSLLANYTGNNTTMEMDITESSIVSEEAGPLDDSGYLRGLRTIRGRNSYKQLKDITLRHVTNRSTRSTAALNTSESQSRPTGTVVGRKRKPDSDDTLELITEPTEPSSVLEDAHAHSKRMRLLDRLAVPFRRVTHTRNAEIVGINTDLPLTAPVASESFDPESLKPQPAPEPPIAVPLAPPQHDRDNKRCIVM